MVAALKISCPELSERVSYRLVGGAVWTALSFVAGE